MTGLRRARRAGSADLASSRPACVSRSRRTEHDVLSRRRVSASDQDSRPDARGWSLRCGRTRPAAGQQAARLVAGPAETASARPAVPARQHSRRPGTPPARQRSRGTHGRLPTRAVAGPVARPGAGGGSRSVGSGTHHQGDRMGFRHRRDAARGDRAIPQRTLPSASTAISALPPRRLLKKLAGCGHLLMWSSRIWG